MGEQGRDKAKIEADLRGKGTWSNIWWQTDSGMRQGWWGEEKIETNVPLPNQFPSTLLTPFKCRHWLTITHFCLRLTNAGPHRHFLPGQFRMQQLMDSSKYSYLKHVSTNWNIRKQIYNRDGIKQFSLPRDEIVWSPWNWRGGHLLQI